MKRGSDEHDIEEEEPQVEEDPSPIQSYAFPLHEEPEEPEKTCAICLDDFGMYCVREMMLLLCIAHL